MDGGGKRPKSKSLKIAFAKQAAYCSSMLSYIRFPKNRVGIGCAVIICLPTIVSAEFDRDAVLYTIRAKETQLMHEKADLAHVQNQMRLLTGHGQNAPVAEGKFASAKSQLQGYHDQLSEVNDQNKWKLIAKMMIKTGKGIHDSINLAKSGTSDLLQHGMSTAVKNFAIDQMKGDAEAQVKKKLGLDIDSLSAPQTRKVAVATQLASSKLKELHGVRRAISLSLDDVKAIIEAETGTAIQSDDVAVMRRNLILRQQIKKAQDAITEVNSQSSETDEDLSQRKAELQVSIDAISRRIEEAKAALAAARQELIEGEVAARLAKVMSQIEDPEDLPLPDVDVAEEPTESYESRVEAAARAEVRAMWAMESTPLMDAIADHKSAIYNLWNNINGRYVDNIQDIQPELFLSKFLGYSPPPPSLYADFTGMASLVADTNETIETIGEAAEEAADLLLLISDLQQEFIDLGNAQSDLQALKSLVQAIPQAWDGLEDGDSLNAPEFVTTQDVGQLASYLSELVDLFPIAKVNAENAQQDLTESYELMGEAAAEYVPELVKELVDGENALQTMVSAAQSYRQMLKQFPTAAPEIGTYTGYANVFRGYWTQPPVSSDPSKGFVRVIDRHFHLRLYIFEMARKMAEDGYMSAATYKASYDNLGVQAERLRDRYAAGWQRLSTAYDQLALLADHYGITIFNDINSASAAASGLAALPDVRGQNARFSKLQAAFESEFTSSMDGGPMQAGQPYASNEGLGQLDELPDLQREEIIEAPLMIHEIFQQMHDAVVLGNSAWLNLAPLEFQNLYWQRRAVVSELVANMRTSLSREIGLYNVREEDFAMIEQAASAVVDALNEASAVYNARNKPIIRSYTESATLNAEVGSSTPVTLTVAVAGRDLEYQWYQSRYNFGGANYVNYDPVVGATSPTLNTTITNRKDFYCYIKNPVGNVKTPPIPVEFKVVTNPLQWVGTTQKSAQVANPFEWDLETTPAGALWELRGAPNWLSINETTGQLQGVPDSPGTLNVLVEVSAGDRSLSEWITLDIAPPPLLDDAITVWLSDYFDASQLANPTFTAMDASPTGDGIPNLTKFALGIDPSRACTANELMVFTGLESGTPTVSMSIAKQAKALGLDISLYEAPMIFGPWVRIHSMLETNESDTHIQLSTHIPDSDRFYRIIVTPPQS